MSAFDKIPGKELYIFPSGQFYTSCFRHLTHRLRTDPLPKDTVAPASAQGISPTPYTFKASQLAATPLAGGSVKIVDSSNFNVSTTIAAAEVTVEPGAIRYVLTYDINDLRN